MTKTAKDPLEHGAWMPATADCYQTLNQTTLDLWRISLNQQPQADVLSEDELTRRDRYRFAADQRKFAVARSSLRQILAGYTQTHAAELVFDYGPHGKPSISNNLELQFNLSHSGEYALCGVAKHTVGVDIEQLRSMDHLDGLIKRCLAPSEQATLSNLLPAQQSSTFLKYWTCKEAYLKATGQGISESLAAIEVKLGPSPQLKVPGKPWQLQLLIPCDGYVAAIAMAPCIIQVRLWDYD